MTHQSSVEILGFYNLMGEGFVVELIDEGNDVLMYDRKGLQYRIISRKNDGYDTSEEERALVQINSFSPLRGYE